MSSFRIIHLVRTQNYFNKLYVCVYREMLWIYLKKMLWSFQINRSNIFLLLQSGMNKIRTWNSHYVEKIDDSEGTNWVWKNSP